MGYDFVAQRAGTRAEGTVLDQSDIGTEYGARMLISRWDVEMGNGLGNDRRAMSRYHK